MAVGMKDETPRSYTGAIRFKKDCRLYVTMPLLSNLQNKSMDFKKGACFVDCHVSYPMMYVGAQCNVSYPDGTFTFDISSSNIEYVSDRVALIDNILADLD